MVGTHRPPEHHPQPGEAQRRRPPSSRFREFRVRPLVVPVPTHRLVRHRAALRRQGLLALRAMGGTEGAGVTDGRAFDQWRLRKQVSER